MTSLKDFSCWYNNKDVVPILEAMQKIVAFYHNKDIDSLNLGCTLPNVVNICHNKSTDAKFYHFTEADKDLMKRLREDVVVSPGIAFTRKLVVDEAFFSKV